MSFETQIIILTGEKDSGKTLVCDALVKKFSGSIQRISGIISLGQYENGKKIAICAIDLSTGIRKVLAHYSPGWDPDKPQREWRFDQETLNWGNEVLAKAIPTDLLFIDEIGYLEFEKNEGWNNALKILDSGKFHYAVIVVRPSLLETAKSRYPDAEVHQLFSRTDIETTITQLTKRLSILQANKKPQ